MHNVAFGNVLWFVLATGSDIFYIFSTAPPFTKTVQRERHDFGDLHQIPLIDTSIYLWVGNTCPKKGKIKQMPQKQTGLAGRNPLNQGYGSTMGTESGRHG